jgi:cytoskeletal protein RodZ
MAAKKPGAAAPSQSAYLQSLDLPRSREKKGISLEQIADRTKISLRFLRAIEAEEFDKLPGGIFRTSYLRQYAAASGFEESRLLEHYGFLAGETPVEAPPAPAQRPRSLFDKWFRMPVEVRH